MKKIYSAILGIAISLTTFSQTNYYVNDGSTTDDVFTSAVGNDLNAGTAAAPFASLNKAISVAITGDIIYVDVGTYTAGGAINKSLTIRGANYLISPNDAADPLLPNGSRIAETIISNASLVIGANNINIAGMTFDPLTNFAIKQTNNTLDFDNVNITKNIFRNKSDNRSIQIYGKFQLPLVTFDCFITDNRFIKDVITGGTDIIVAGINNVQVLNNTFTVSTDIANRAQTSMNFGTFRMDNLLVRYNTTYRQNALAQGVNSKRARFDFNKAIESNRFILAFTSIAAPCEVDIVDNIVIDDKSTGGPVISYARSFGSDISSPNIARIERNTITLNATGLTSIAQALIAPTVDNNSPNTQVYIRGNTLKISGDFSAQTNTDLYVSGIRFLNNSRQAVVENNDIEFTGVNYGTGNKFGIGVLHSGLLPDAIFNFNGNKISGFPTSIGIQSIALNAFGNLPAGVTMNINNNSFTGDVMSINNGTSSQEVQATCNWYGYTAVQDLVNKVSVETGQYVPWLTNGTDNEPSTTGFQPVPGSCNGQPIQARLDGYTNVTCNGANNGTASVTVFNGVAPFVFSWTKDGDPLFSSSAEDPTNFGPGTYHLIITDALGTNLILDESGDFRTIDVTITEPPILTASASGTDVSCFGGSDGAISLSVSGGTEPYTYLWSNNATTEEITNLLPGAYSVTITDANGCTAQASYTVTQPTLLTAVATGTSTSCANSATVVASGGTTPYSYSWSNGATTQSITSLPAGTYSVTVTDANGCTTSANCTVTANEAFNPSASVVDVSCFGSTNGSITVTNVNATAPFQFSIDGVNFQPGILPYTFNNLAAGTYTISVRDANGCTGFVIKTILQPPLLTAVIDNVQSACYGQNTGAINITVSGGSGALSYNWTGPNSYTSGQKNINGLAAGNYVLTVTDNNGCVTIINAAVPNFNEIVVNAVVINILCKGEISGSIDLTISGGTGSGFSYLWNNGATTQGRTNLGVANYSVTITDIGSGCVVTGNYSISQPASAVNISASKTNVTGCASLGTVTASGSGGTSPYTYSLDGINYQSSGSFTGLYAGSYTAWVKDANGCIKTSALLSITDNGTDEFESNNSKNQSKSISTGTTIMARIALATDVADWFKFITASAGSYTLIFTHLSAGFTFNMYPAGNNAAALVPTSSTTTTKVYTLAASTTYYISVTGGLSYTCYQLSVTTTSPLRSSESKPQNEVVSRTAGKESFDIRAFPNPSGSYFNLKVETASNEKMSLRVMDVSGRLIEERSNLSAEQMIRLGDRYINGMYMAEITQGKNRKVVKLVKM